MTPPRPPTRYEPGAFEGEGALAMGLVVALLAICLALLVGWKIGSRATRPATTPAQVAADPRVIHLFDWQGGGVEVCSCVPGRVGEGPAVKRRPASPGVGP